MEPAWGPLRGWRWRCGALFWREAAVGVEPLDGDHLRLQFGHLHTHVEAIKHMSKRARMWAINRAQSHGGDTGASEGGQQLQIGARPEPA